jgi:hypothetical protein
MRNEKVEIRKGKMQRTAGRVCLAFFTFTFSFFFCLACSFGGDLETWRQKVIKANSGNAITGTPCTITFNINGGSGTAPSDRTANSGSTITLPGEGGLTRSGYTFGGWITNSSGTGTNYPAGSTYPVTGDATLYAWWIVPVTGITSVPATAVVGTSLTLSGTVQPANATNTAITWSVVSGPATVSGNTLNTTAPGTVTVRATIADGLAIGVPYTQNFTVTVQQTQIFTITFDQIADAMLPITGPVIHRSSANGQTTATLTVNNPGQYDSNSINWYITGTLISGSGSSITLDSANTAYNRIGRHFVTVEVTKDGIPYNQTIVFTVAE